MNYKTLRTAYYSGIFILVAYALPKIEFIKDWFYPILQYEVVTGVPVISIVGILTGVGAFSAVKYRKIG